MQTLIINGSPKKDGDTTALIHEFTKYLHGEYRILSCYSNIAPCNDCRFCWKNEGCSISDEMQEVYEYLEKCDNVVIASPIWFSSLSGPTLNLTSRIQTLYASHAFRNEPLKDRTKHSVIILVGGEPGTQDTAITNALTILKFMGAYRPAAATICSMNTNHIPTCEDEMAKSECRLAAEKLNELCGSN